jgi:hypothetical protein
MNIEVVPLVMMASGIFLMLWSFLSTAIQLWSKTPARDAYSEDALCFLVGLALVLLVQPASNDGLIYKVGGTTTAIILTAAAYVTYSAVQMHERRRARKRAAAISRQRT